MESNVSSEVAEAFRQQEASCSKLVGPLRLLGHFLRNWTNEFMILGKWDGHNSTLVSQKGSTCICSTLQEDRGAVKVEGHMS